jgi:hypothetical protein
MLFLAWVVGRLHYSVQEALQIGLIHGGFAGGDVIEAALFHPLLQAPHQAEEMVEGIHDKQ